MAKKLKKGDRVRMSEALKKQMRTPIKFRYGTGSYSSKEHVREFGNCVGIVLGFTDYINEGDELDIRKIGPEVEVRWLPSKLCYAYDSKDLEVVT